MLGGGKPSKDPVCPPAAGAAHFARGEYVRKRCRARVQEQRPWREQRKTSAVNSTVTGSRSTVASPATAASRLETCSIPEPLALASIVHLAKVARDVVRRRDISCASGNTRNALTVDPRTSAVDNRQGCFRASEHVRTDTMQERGYYEIITKSWPSTPSNGLARCHDRPRS